MSGYTHSFLEMSLKKSINPGVKYKKQRLINSEERESLSYKSGFLNWKLGKILLYKIWYLNTLFPFYIFLYL